VKYGCTLDLPDDRDCQVFPRQAKLPTAVSLFRYPISYEITTTKQAFYNDRYGTCSVAALAAILTETSGYWARDEDALSTYKKLTGGLDVGVSPKQVFDLARKDYFCGHLKPLQAYARVTLQDIPYALTRIGAVYAVFKLPEHKFVTSDQEDYLSPKSGKSYPKYLHAVAILAYDRRNFFVRSWGRVYKVNQEFLKRYFVEAWALLITPCTERSIKSPTVKRELNYAEIKEAFKSL
jgi:hypothetical protein